MPTAAHTTTVKTNGATTAFVNSAFSVTAGNTWQIDDVSKRIWDPAVTPTFRDNLAADITADVLSLDYLFGKVTFNGPHTPGDGSGSYFPMVAVASAKEFNLSLPVDLLDTTDFKDTTGYRTRILGISDASGSISTLDDLRTDLFGTTDLFDLLTAGNPLVLEIHPAAAGQYWRLWALFSGETLAGPVDGLVTGSLDFQLAVKVALDGTEIGVSYGA